MIKSKETAEVLKEYQLKATDTPNYVREHQERDPDIVVIVTDEVAAKLEGVRPVGS
ncbi:MAG: hypothetical protein L3J05_03830 [Robiginitomaculum sp.]|nr:hypothetical protein [Robiginitomaculum sp.]